MKRSELVAALARLKDKWAAEENTFAGRSLEQVEGVRILNRRLRDLIDVLTDQC